MAIQSDYQAQSAFTWRGVHLFCPDQSEVSDMSILQAQQRSGEHCCIYKII